MRYIEDFKEDDHITEHYLCKQKMNLKSRAGKTYLSLKLQDKTGIIDAKVWDLSNDIQNFDENDFIRVDGVVLTYQNELQMKVTKIRKSQEGEYDAANYIPCTDKDIGGLYTQIVEYVKSITNVYIKQLLTNILIKNERIAGLFKDHSAAKSLHHSYMGGLIEHTLSVTQLCEFLSPRYKFVNRDLLVCCAILHDIGKVYELSAFPDNDYTDEGQLLGHIYIGSQLVSEEMEKIEKFPDKLKTLIKHCILSHHGEYEFGSPKRPKIIEAYILHFADNLDAKVKAFEEMLETDNTSGYWVGYNKSISRNIRKSDFNV